MKRYLLILIFFLLFFSDRLMAAGTATVRGVPITMLEDIEGFYALRFNSYTLGTSNAYIFNDAGGTSSTAGALKVRGLNKRSVQMDITNMKEPGTNTVGFFMANGTDTPTLWSLVYEAIFNGTVTSSGTQTGTIGLTEQHDYSRIGIKREGDNSADFTVKETYTK